MICSVLTLSTLNTSNTKYTSRLPRNEDTSRLYEDTIYPPHHSASLVLVPMYDFWHCAVFSCIYIPPQWAYRALAFYRRVDQDGEAFPSHSFHWQLVYKRRRVLRVAYVIAEASWKHLASRGREQSCAVEEIYLRAEQCLDGELEHLDMLVLYLGLCFCSFCSDALPGTRATRGTQVVVK